MPVAVPPPDRDRPRTRPGSPGRPRRRGAAAPLRPAAVAGLALLLALATLREPVAGPPAEDVRSDAGLYSPPAGPEADDAAAGPAAPSPGAGDGATLRRPVATADDLPPGDGGEADPASLDEAGAGAVALRVASRLAWQATGSFGVAPFGGAWSTARPAAPASDPGLATDQNDER